MVLGKIILWISALAFTGYGLVCLVAPTIPAEFAGIELGNGDAYAEIGAMYGGLQLGLGIFCLLAARSPALYRAGLILLVIGIGALALARLLSAITAPDTLTSYTYGALIYELVTASLAAVALRRARSLTGSQDS